jgi:SpoVK/Ycf46/Vps4 family AAA+-type ATPase
MAERVSILRVQLKGCQLDSRVDLRRVAALADGYSGADLKEVCKLAAARSVRKLLRDVTKDEFQRFMATDSASSEMQSASDSQRHVAQEPSSLAAVVVAASAAAVLGAASTSQSTFSVVPASDGATFEPSPLPASRAINFSDFKSALRAIRPSGAGLRKQLQDFHTQHRSQQPHAASHDESEGEDEEQEEGVSDENSAVISSASSRAATHSSKLSSSDEEIYR